MWRVAVWAVLLLGWACLPTCSHSRSALPFHSPLFSSLTKKSRSHSRTRISSSRVKQRVSDDVDEELYSRQLLVLGRDSQLRLKDSHVALTGTGPVAWEVAKNLALAGVGRMSVVADEGGFGGPGDKLMSYIQALNPSVQVSHFPSLTALKVENCSLVVLTGMPITEAESANIMLRRIGVQSVYSRVYGTSGVVFTDLLNSVHELKPTSSEQEVFLDEASIIQRTDPVDDSLKVGDHSRGQGQAPLLEIKCLVEEEFSVGLADDVMLNYGNISVPCTVDEVVDRHTIVLRVPNTLSKSTATSIFRDIVSAFQVPSSRVVLKLPQARLAQYNHDSLSICLTNVTRIIPSNSCDDSMLTRWRDMLLLRLMKNADSTEMLSMIGAWEDYSILKGMEETITPEKRQNLVNEVKALWRSIIQSKCLPNIKSGGSSFHECPATVSVLGAIAAQEVLKACTRTYSPLSQVYIHQPFDAVAPSAISHGKSGDSIHHDLMLKGGDKGLVSLYGNTTVEQLRNLNVLVVGVGAIGCEVLKVLHQLSVGQSNGSVTITDPDYIERSNLNRQLFFRERDIGLSKAIIAAKYLKNLSSNQFNVKSMTLALSPENEHVFNPEFWKNIDVVISALDSTEARLYVDKMAVSNAVWMIDAGTTGLKGSTQVIIPYVSESYASMEDVPDKTAPICTLKAFPYKVEHCIAWSKVLFETVFVADIELLKSLMSHTNSTAFLDSDFLLEEGVARRLFNNLMWPQYASRKLISVEDEVQQNNLDRNLVQGSLLNALLLFHEVFCDEIDDLIARHPLDSYEDGEFDEDKSLFWGKNRIYPRIVKFDKTSMTHKTFVMNAARIMCRSRGLNFSTDLISGIYESSIDAMLESYFAGKDHIDMSAILFSYSQGIGERKSPSHYIEMIRELISRVSSSPTGFLLRLKGFKSAMFEAEGQKFLKDSDEAGHVDFCTAATNIRASIYHISPVDKLYVQQITGNIIPAVATTTALVSGLVGVELVKVASEKARLKELRVDEKTSFSEMHKSSRIVESDTGTWNRQLFSIGSKLRKVITRKLQSHSTPTDKLIYERQRVLERFRNYFIDLDGPMITYSQPLAAEQLEIEGDSSTSTFTLWDNLKISNKDTKSLTISILKKYLLNNFGVDLISFTCEGVLLYASFLPQFADSDLDVLTVHDLIDSLGDEDIGVSSLRSNAIHVDLQVYCENHALGYGVQLPKVRILKG